MKHPIAIADSVIITAVRDYFGIHLHSLEFLPVGEGSWAYKGIDANKLQWFVKLSRLDTSSIAHVTSYLRNERDLSFVLSPIASKGKGAIPKINNTYLSAYPFLEGETLSYANLSARYRIEIAGDLRRMHDVELFEDIAKLIPEETFNKYQASASELVIRAKNYDENDMLLRGLKDFIDSGWSIIDRTLVNGHSISEFCKRRTYELAVCHADIHPFNIMKTPNGLMMIDWDGIMLAPRERDLMFYGKDILSADSDFHRAYGLDYQADKYLISYYNYEWVLQEYTDYIERLFDLSLAEQAREHALEEFMRLFGSGKEPGGVVKGALDSPLP